MRREISEVSLYDLLDAWAAGDRWLVTDYGVLGRERENYDPIFVQTFETWSEARHCCEDNGYANKGGRFAKPESLAAYTAREAIGDDDISLARVVFNEPGLVVAHILALAEVLRFALRRKGVGS